ncbi:MAG: orotidine-5'-phosphate decarboxylase, partial [Patescibacteria group bacterium]|nr:orotidine-5'-phosphate decarboxylase [Patescibacteria group bacterium]
NIKGDFLMTTNKDRSTNPACAIIVALDGMSLDDAKVLVQKLGHLGVGFKVGLEFICAGEADELLGFVKECGGWAFYDSKLCDIPNTVGKAAKKISKKDGARFFNIHASCGKKAMEAAVANKGDCWVLAVTVLTSIDEEECESIFGDSSESIVLQFAINARDAGVNGIICSPKELPRLRGNHDFEPRGPELLLITPGVRPLGTDANDQKRITTPYEAIKGGANYLVIGRPITEAPDPVEAVKAIANEIATAMGEVGK